MGSVSTAHLELERVALDSGERVDRDEPGRESVVVILSGRCSVVVGTDVHELSRESVFAEKASAVYVPAGRTFSIEASTSAEIVVCCGEAAVSGEPMRIDGESVACRSVGRAAYQRRVCDIVGLDVPAQHLVLGETYNEPGKWSSFPPHKHDEDRLPVEAAMEEIYLFKVDPVEGFGLQRLYSPKDGYDRAVVLRDNAMVTIPEGYHPVGAAPGCSLYYLWVLWGERRELAPFDDPGFESVKARLAAEE